MDPRTESTPGDTLVVTGLGCLHDETCDVTPWLVVRKNRKFMGLQDVLAVTAAGRALAAAGLAATTFGEKIGLYLTVGYIPFEQADIDGLMEASTVDGKFSLAGFFSHGFQTANPLLTFRCLCNMPAYHVSFNFDIRGAYVVTYPDIGQWYAALETACLDLRAGRVEVALVGGVAHQRNYLVEHHHARLTPPVAPEQLHNDAGFIVLERGATARKRGAKILFSLLEMQTEYASRAPFAGATAGHLSEASMGASNPAAPVLALARSLTGGEMAGGRYRHEFSTREGVRGWSEWELA